jgi:hypothetical protein
VRLQRKIAAVADLPWFVATSEDLRRQSTAGKQSRSQQLISSWSAELIQLMTRGDRGACRALRGVYHLMARPTALFHPGLFLSAGLAAIRGMPAAAPRPAVLDSLAPEGSRAAASPDPAIREPRQQET